MRLNVVPDVWNMDEEPQWPSPCERCPGERYCRPVFDSQSRCDEQREYLGLPYVKLEEE